MVFNADLGILSFRLYDYGTCYPLLHIIIVKFIVCYCMLEWEYTLGEIAHVKFITTTNSKCNLSVETHIPQRQDI